MRLPHNCCCVVRGSGKAVEWLGRGATGAATRRRPAVGTVAAACNDLQQVFGIQSDGSRELGTFAHCFFSATAVSAICDSHSVTSDRFL